MTVYINEMELTQTAPEDRNAAPQPANRPESTHREARKIESVLTKKLRILSRLGSG